jgi:hypothetical protein
VARRTQLYHEIEHGCFQPRKAEVEAVAGGMAQRLLWQGKGGWVALAGCLLDGRPPRKPQIQQACNLVERFAAGIVEGPSQAPIAAMAADS